MTQAELRFNGRVALITGGGRGMGQAHADFLAARGATVVVSDSGAEADGKGGDTAVAESAAEAICRAGGAASAYSADLMTEDGARGAVSHAVDRHGRLDIIIHNAGFSRSKPFDESAIADLDDLFAVNIRAGSLIAAAAWPIMAAQGFGRIIFVGSTAMYGMGDAAYYATVKAAYLGLTRSLAEAARTLGITVNLVCPSGATRLADTMEASAFRDWFLATMRNELVTALVAYLVHERCTMSGEAFAAAGGRVARILLGETQGIVDSRLTAEKVRDTTGTILQDTSFTPFADYIGSAALLMDVLGYTRTQPLAPLSFRQD